MTTYHYTLNWAVLDAVNGTLVKDRTDGVLVDLNGQQQPATTLLGVPTTIKTGPAGTTIPFMAEIPIGRVKFGDVEAAVFADEQGDAAERAEAAQAAAENVLTQVTRIADTSTEMSYVTRDVDGTLVVVDTPVALTDGGAKLRIDPATGYVTAEFLV